ARNSRHHRARGARAVRGRWTGDCRENAVSRPLLPAGQSRVARPSGSADGGRRGPDAVRGGDPRRRLSPTGAKHAVPLCHRAGGGTVVARLFLLDRQARGAMTSSYERVTRFFEGSLRQRRPIVTPEGVPLTIELADYGERLVAFVLDLF